MFLTSAFLTFLDLLFYAIIYQAMLDCVRRIIDTGVLEVGWNFDQFSAYNLEELNC
jgi:hypothetical protein